MSPTFEFKSTTGISSPISSFESDKEDLDVDSPSDNSFKTKQTRSSHSKGFSKEGHYNENTEDPSPNLPDSPLSPLITGGHKENGCSGSPSEVMETQTSEDASPLSVPIILKNHQGKKRPVISSTMSEEYSESSGRLISPIKGDEDCDKSQDDSQQDGLVGAVKLFALALERVERKIHSTTSKQSAAILLSVSENIHSQLQNAESKIQNEVGKLTSLGKSKRMHPENQLR
ncbi:meiosis-specific protein ASY3, partial [Tanacetum coccineum]